MLSYCCSASVLHCCDGLIHTIRCDACHSSLITAMSTMAQTRAQNQAAPKLPPKSSTSHKRAMSATSDKLGKRMKKQQKKEEALQEASKEGGTQYATHPFPRFRRLTRSPPHPFHLPCIKTPAAHYLELPLPMADPVRTHQRLPTGCPLLCNNHHLSQHQ